MVEFPHALRRAITEATIRKALLASARIPTKYQRRTVRSLVTFAGGIPMLRRKLRENVRLALGTDLDAEAESRYFRQVAWWLSNAIATFHHGVCATPVFNEVRFDESIELFDDAIAEGRGAVITSPHWSGHELVAAKVNRRHSMALLVRQSPTTERMARKLNWYSALGTEIVLRPNRASTIKDAVACLNLLKAGKVLAISPDLLAGEKDGVEARLFGRPVRLYGGAFAIAMSARAPMLRPFFRWQSESSLVVSWERAPEPPKDATGNAAVRVSLQNWCHWFEERLRANPENWLFWLDKRWSRFLRSTPRAFGEL
jgi:lauroyl/myristoyl acyltransferase